MSLASELSVRLARNAEAVCRHYLSAGRRYGNYWIVGDTANNQGRSLYVHLTGSRAGRWTDAATGQYGDLLDLLRETCDLVDFLDVADEARQFLRLSRADASHLQQPQKPARTSRPASERARRLFAMARPINKTLADRYLRSRCILWAARYGSLRFHPHCFYRDLETGKTSGLPALIAAVTDSAGTITGVHRTWLDPRGDGKAKVQDPRRALGGLLGCRPLHDAGQGAIGQSIGWGTGSGDDRRRGDRNHLIAIAGQPTNSDGRRTHRKPSRRLQSAGRMRAPLYRGRCGCRRSAWDRGFKPQGPIARHPATSASS